jgi:DNA-binding NarL/FixJ family response regulator
MRELHGVHQNVIATTLHRPALELLEHAPGPGLQAGPVMRRRFDMLSERERDVVRLLSRGLSNAEIAEELFLSEGTVKTYVTRTLNKLRLRSRVQVVVAAYDAGLVTPRAM